MKKLLLILVAATMTLSGFAAGTGDGSSKANAIEFDWVNGNTQEGGSAAKWYRVDLSQQDLTVDNPNIALYLTNMTSSKAKVTITALIDNDDESRTYTIDGNQSKTWSTSAKMLVNMGYEELFVKLETDQKIRLAAKVFEGTFADEACLKAVAYDTKDHTIAKGTHWYSIDLKTLRDNKQGLKITYSAEKGTSKIVSMISTDCPSTGLSGLKSSVPNKQQRVHEIAPALIQSMPEAVSTLYLKVENSKELSVKTEMIQMPEPPAEFKEGWDFSNPASYDFEKSDKVSIETTKIYRVALADLIPVDEKDKTKKHLEPQIVLNNEKGTTDAKVTMEIAFKEDAVDNYKTLNVIVKEETVAAGEAINVDFARNMLESLDATSCKYVYIRITGAKDMQAYARLKHMRESNACGESAQSVRWDETIYLDVQTDDESATAWYAIDINEPKQAKQDLTITITNRGEAAAEVTAELAFSCPSVDAEQVTRKIEKGKFVTKTINYSMVATLSDVIYVGVTSTQSLKVKVDAVAAEKNTEKATCKKDEAKKITNLEEGGRQKAGEAVWYEVAVKDIKKLVNDDFTPEMVITNEGSKTLTINGEISYDCPDEYENQKRSLTIAANGSYQKEFDKKMLASMDNNDTLYVKVKGDQDFNFRFNKKVDNEGASCSKAIPFNWTTGHNQDANTTLWYVINLDTVQKSTGKKVHMILKNLTGKDATIDGLFSPECPATSPQGKTIELKGNQVLPKDIARSSFLAFGEKVYIRLTSTQKFHFEASFEDADPFDEIKCEDMNYTEVTVNTDYPIATGGKAWYRMKTVDLKDDTRAPELKIVNGGVAQAIKASIAYVCPVTEEMMSTTRSFAANQTLTKMIEQSMVAQIQKYEYVYVLVEAEQGYTFRIDMVNPNKGQDCMHAMEIKADVDYPHEAGKTLWYKVDAKNLRSSGKKLTFSLTNKGGVASVVNAAAYTDCEGSELMSGNATLAAGATREKSISADALMGVNSDWVYLKLTSEQAMNLKMHIADPDPLPKNEQINLCGDDAKVTTFAINTDFNQAAGDTVWYRVNIKELRENTVGDATLIVTNLSSEENKMEAAMSWVCDIKNEMSEKNLVLKGNDVYNRVFGSDMLNSAEDKDVVYIRVIADKQMKFRVNMHLNKGDRCDNPMDFDWKNGNVNPEGECVWYNVEMLKDTVINGRDTAVLRIDEGKDLIMHIENQGDKKATASASLRFECLEASMGTKQYTLEAKNIDGSSKEWRIDRDLIEMYHPTSLVVNFCTPTTSMRIWATIEAAAPKDTTGVNTEVAICPFDGSVEYNFEDNIIGKTYQVYNDTVIIDTVSVRQGTMLKTTIDTFTIYVQQPFKAKNFNNTEVPEASQVVAKDGEKLNYSAMDAYLREYYNGLAAKDMRLASVDTIVWYAKNDKDEWVDIADVFPETKVLTKEDIKNLVLSYVIGNTCGAESKEAFVYIDNCQPFNFGKLDWGKAFCGQSFNVDAVIAQIKANPDATDNDVITISYDLGDGFKPYTKDVKMIGDKVEFKAEVVRDCGTPNEVTQKLTIEDPDGESAEVTGLPLVSEYDGWVLVINLNEINEKWGLNLKQGDETEKQVKWYRMVGTAPVMDKGDEFVKTGGYYLTEKEKLKQGTYYAVIDIVATVEQPCGGTWRTITSIVNKAASVSTRKQMINGKLYIITGDNEVYDAQGQKVQ